MGSPLRARPITIAAREEYGRLVLTVSDDGPGTSGNHGFGIGLANVRDRIEARFGNAATIVSGPSLTGYETELQTTDGETWLTNPLRIAQDAYRR